MKKLGLLALALVLALGSLGIGYALWYEILYIDGTVYTGELNAEWSLHGYEDDETKDYSYVDAYIDGDTLYVYVGYAYPSINYYVYFDVYNSGSIPFHLCPLLGPEMTTPHGYFPGYVRISDVTPPQVHPGYEAVGTIHIHLDNRAEELTTYKFNCTLPIVQYNEDCSQLPPEYLPD